MKIKNMFQDELIVPKYVLGHLLAVAQKNIQDKFSLKNIHNKVTSTVENVQDGLIVPKYVLGQLLVAVPNAEVWHDLGSMLGEDSGVHG